MKAHPLGHSRAALVMRKDGPVPTTVAALERRAQQKFLRPHSAMYKVASEWLLDSLPVIEVPGATKAEGRDKQPFNMP